MGAAPSGVHKSELPVDADEAENGCGIPLPVSPPCRPGVPPVSRGVSLGGTSFVGGGQNIQNGGEIPKGFIAVVELTGVTGGVTGGTGGVTPGGDGAGPAGDGGGPAGDMWHRR